MSNDKFDPESVRFHGTGFREKPKKKSADRFYKPRKGERFLRGPVPLWWMNATGSLPGRAFQVAMRLWFLSGFKNDPRVKLNLSAMKEMGVLRDAASRGLHLLENAGLVTVDRGKGRASWVTIVFDEDKFNGNGKESEMDGVS